MQGFIGRKGLAVLQLRLTGGLAAAGFALGVGSAFFPAVCGIVLAVTAGVYPFAAAFWLPRWCCAFCFHAESEQLCLGHGLLWHKTVLLTRNKIRYVSVTATPMQRMLGVASLRLMTAGGKVILPQLNQGTVLQLAELLHFSIPADSRAGRRQKQDGKEE